MLSTSWITILAVVSLVSVVAGSDDLLVSENGNVFRERRQPQQQKPKEDDDKKTLSQQVIDGKYGLIQKELFHAPPKRPGIISYDSNNEVPKDNANTLGGLNKTDIWLAENHLLVLKGGLYPLEDAVPDFSKPAWPPIDNFLAPRRPVKIPEHPKVPPPFPVQLVDGGPIQILGTNSSGTPDGAGFPPPYALPPLEGYVPGSGPLFPPAYPYPSNATAGQSPYAVPPFAAAVPGDGPPPFPFPLNGSLPPFFDYLPPGAAILPPPNLTEPLDEDDLSIYYPPPYSFYYQQDNATEVPPGPLVPGIILPPPPDFFAPLDPPKRNTSKTTTQPVPQIHPTTTPPPSTTTSTIHIRPTYLPPPKPSVKFVHTNYTRILLSTPAPPSRSYLPIKTINSTRLVPTNVTVLKQVKLQTPPPSGHVASNLVDGPNTRSDTISSTPVPLQRVPSAKKSSSAQSPNAEYYFYEETPPATHTVPPPKQIYRVTTPYVFRKKPTVTYKSTVRTVKVQPQTQPEYYYVTNKPYPIQHAPQKPDTFRAHIEQLQQQIQSYRNVPKFYQQPQQQPAVPSPKPVYQYSFQVANYEEQHQKFTQPPTRYSVEIQPAVEITTETPAQVYQTTAPSPLYQNTPAPPFYFKKNVASPQKYYNPRPNYDYHVVTPAPVVSTQNPLFQYQYTQQDETKYLDDITRTYFTTFGQKLASTTAGYETTARPVPLDRDILVNYAQPLPNREPQADFVPQRPAPVRYTGSKQASEQRVAVQTVQAIGVPIRPQLKEGPHGSFISYELPGDDGAHFYFLTPQLADRRDQGVSYYYSKPFRRLARNRSG